MASTLTPREIAERITPTVLSLAAYDSWGEVINTGSGFLVNDHGTFVTNLHVVDGAARVRVELATGERFENVYWLSSDEARDIAVLKILAENTPTVVLGEDEDIEVGDAVYVMGNPLGLDRTFSNGIVSARRIVEGSATIQITAPVSPGSSGGPVTDERGHVIGIATWYYEFGQNLNMAVPVRYVRPLLAAENVPIPFGDAIEPETMLVARPVETTLIRNDVTGQARSEDRWEQQVIDQLTELEEALRPENLTRSHAFVLADLDEQRSKGVILNVQEGVSYLIAGACDEDCDDLDLYLYDSDMSVLDMDIEYGDLPLVVYHSDSDAQLTLRVTMYSCYVEPCRFGVAVFRAH
ncbi:MAG: trypsin-like peptidase domain-containing protein [Chromatiales bacterium]|nr:trypsin-like peptidase domain-containing protein [Chromatiales bacterium]